MKGSKKKKAVIITNMQNFRTSVLIIFTVPEHVIGLRLLRLLILDYIVIAVAPFAFLFHKRLKHFYEKQ
jgi:hypothetical protein